MGDRRVIKRYANRKLYDTQHSCYVTLDQIASMIRAGEDVQILDNRSKEDLTSVTLAQIIFEEEKKRRLLPLVGLKQLIQTSGESLQEFVSQVKGGVEGSVGRVFRRNKDGEVVGEGELVGGAETGIEGERAAATPDLPVAETPVLAEGDGENPRTMAAVREFLETSQRRLDEWQAVVDDQLHKMVQSLSPLAPLQSELRAVLDKIGELESRLGELEEKITKP